MPSNEIRAWTPEELDSLGAADELQNAPRRADGTLLRARPTWVVRPDRAGDDAAARARHE